MSAFAPVAGPAPIDGDVLPLVRLLQLASPALPIGAYSYSQGLEWMIDSGAIPDVTAVQRWIGDVLECVVADGEAAVLARLINACERDDRLSFAQWSAWHRASRESRELRAETEQMGASLVKLASDLGMLDDASVALAASVAPITLPGAFALACNALGIRADAALAGYTMSFLVRPEALASDRIIGVETGGCPHTAIREDASINLEAVDRLARRFGNLDLIFVESGGDNLAATFSPELSDLTLYVIDVAAGDKIPRKGGPGITRSDLLIINKIDLAPYVGASLDVMDRDARRMRGDAPFVFTNLKTGTGVDGVIAFIEKHGLLDRG